MVELFQGQLLVLHLMVVEEVEQLPLDVAQEVLE